MLRAIIIDDEPDSIEALSHDIKSFGLQVDIVAKCESGKHGLKAIKKHQPDVIFLDVEMPYMSGFEMLELIDNINFEVIFVTAYDQYALEAFKMSAAHFLLKPVDEEDLVKAIEKVQKLRSTQHQEFSKKHLEVLLKNIQPEIHTKRFAVPTMNGYVFYPLEDILYCKANGNSTTVVAKGKNFVSGHPLKEFELRLPEKQFCRIHNSHIINMMHITSYHKGKSGYVTMSDGQSLNVAEKRRESFVRRFKW